LNLTDEPLERETPPGSNGAKKVQEMWNMHGHMHIGERFNIGMYKDEIVYVLSHILKVSCRVTCIIVRMQARETAETSSIV
jgi:hypothetical protein